MAACIATTPSHWDPRQAAKHAAHEHQATFWGHTPKSENESPQDRWRLIHGQTVDTVATARTHAALRQLASGELSAAAAADRLGTRKENVEFPPSGDTALDRLYPDAVAERQRWLEILPSCTDDLKRIWRFRECGSDSWVCYNHDDDSYHIESNRCHLRICPHCRLQVQKKNARRIEQQVGNIGWHQWQFITLTMRHTTASLTHQLAQLRQAFRRLRQRKCWRQAVERGYAVIEIGWSGDRQEWHPHLHVVAQTPYIDWSKLRDDWRKVTQGSDQIDCRWVDDQKEAIAYICKYVGKPPDVSCLSTVERAREYLEGLYCGRFLIPFGNHPTPEEPDDPTEDKPQKTRICSLSALLRLAIQGWVPAQRIWQRIADSVARDTDFQRRLQRSTYLKPGTGLAAASDDTS